MACLNSKLYDVAKTLFELGDNVNVYFHGTIKILSFFSEYV